MIRAILGRVAGFFGGKAMIPWAVAAALALAGGSALWGYNKGVSVGKAQASADEVQRLAGTINEQSAVIEQAEERYRDLDRLLTARAERNREVRNELSQISGRLEDLGLAVDDLDCLRRAYPGAYVDELQPSGAGSSDGNGD